MIYLPSLEKHHFAVIFGLCDSEHISSEFRVNRYPIITIPVAVALLNLAESEILDDERVVRIAYPFKPFETEKSPGDRESNPRSWKPTFRTCFQPKNPPETNYSEKPTTRKRSREIDSFGPTSYKSETICRLLPIQAISFGPYS